MTKKHFKAVAQIMVEEEPDIGAYAARRIVIRLADFFAEEFPTFDREKFLAAALHSN